jgi:hypothetical protein
MNRPQRVREAVARSYPGWDRDRADRLLLWLDECGYTIVEKEPKHGEAALVPDGQPIVDRAATSFAGT